jgi:hypothetical protein
MWRARTPDWRTRSSLRPLPATGIVAVAGRVELDHRFGKLAASDAMRTRAAGSVTPS